MLFRSSFIGSNRPSPSNGSIVPFLAGTHNTSEQITVLTYPDFIHRECRFGSMEQTIQRADMDADQVTARCEDDVLYITIPIKDNGQSGKQIPID